jgi:hypothetical protein
MLLVLPFEALPPPAADAVAAADCRFRRFRSCCRFGAVVTKQKELFTVMHTVVDAAAGAVVADCCRQPLLLKFSPP